ncbi:MAG TPA: 50S ribosomal protein L31 [bacterium]|nr:50S ribosomal protein L31 [bacterium]
MKKTGHPKYNDKITVTCACGNKFETGSVKPELVIEICSNCHPFYSGKQKLIDTTRRVEKFQAKMAKSQALPKADKKAKAAKRTKKTSSEA